MNEDPEYWILNPISKIFDIVPKKIKPLEEPVFKKRNSFKLNQLAWIPRNIKLTPKLVRKLSNDFKEKYKNRNFNIFKNRNINNLNKKFKK